MMVHPSGTARYPHGSAYGRTSAVLALGLLVTAATVSAFDVELDVQPRVLQVGEVATLSLSVHGLANPAMPQLPSIDGFDVHSSGTEQRFSIGTGGHSRTVVFNYQLLARRAGRFSIGPFEYQANGKTVTLPAIGVQVAAGAGGSSGNSGEAQLGDLLFARVQVERPTVYHQEFFDVYISVFFRGLRLGRSIDATGLPSGISFGGLEELRSTREVVNGQVFEVRRFRTRAHALTAGTFTLQPSVQAQLRIQRPRAERRSIFDDFFGSAFGEQYQAVQIKPNSLEVEVKPLPAEGRPDQFSGAVGRFTFDVQVAPTQLVAGEPITITSTVSGHGNISSVSAPALVLGDDFKVYEPKLLEKNVQEGSGTKKFEQVIIPRTEAASEIPAIQFSFFDPEQAAYQSLSRGPFELTVTPSPNGPSRIVDGNLGSPAGRAAEILGRDIVYLKPMPSHWTRVARPLWQRSPAFLALQGTPLLALAITFFFTRRRTQLARDVARARRLKAPRSARPGLKHAEEALRSGRVMDVYEGLSQASGSYFGNRLNLSPGDVEIDRVTGQLRENGLDAAYIERLLAVLSACERGRFAQGADGAATTGTEQHQRLAALIADMKDVLKACERVKL